MLNGVYCVSSLGPVPRVPPHPPCGHPLPQGEGLKFGHLRFQRQKGVATGIPACQTRL